MCERPAKTVQRRLAYVARNAQQDKERLSRVISDKVLALNEYQQAKTVLWYLHCRSEVHTYNTVLTELLNRDKQIVIPYCTKDTQGNNQLGLWHLEDISELSAGTWGILEPPKERWGEPGKEIAIEQIDVAIVPGVAFDAQGGRLGNGAGYYDRLFACLAAKSKLIGICFDSQIFEQILMQEYDVYMHTVITETHIYKCGDR
ncbi:5-formyltetrahydrofolate cyclo-ligase [Methyloprofundus sedimenti]|uniref:5-formyltetrahydrofolate cyclo-ligase n=1 Tax=Methyloprofundus sedimenti TaxID=1420851 RepID=A0A1V8M8B2_9GAMM|nr:5-formyltetrahydrofolate cyclo-ligase [Methyloprofundus sedimenti]OQK17762.1 5-formyltetrahydrofolate cyclo-ligase [Methyloprofundus sedimenti]